VAVYRIFCLNKIPSCQNVNKINKKILFGNINNEMTNENI
jgi:hypothetical protein